MEDIIVVEKLSKRFGDLEAVKGVSFSVKKGEIFAFLGPNGAGKTTTINMLTTLLKPTSGKAVVAGHDVVKEPKEVRKKIGIVFQDQSLDRELTAYENMYIHGRIYGHSGEKLKKKILELLEFVELLDFKDKPVKTFSGGMARRLEIARSLIHEPEVLFLDEPTIGLDPHTRAHIWEYISKMKKEHNMTIFLTTHYMDEAEQLADRVAIIDHGKIIALGSPDELKQLVGKEVIYVKFADSVDCIESEIIKECKKLSDGRLELNVENSSTAIPKIFEIAQKKGIRIEEITYHKPTLNDVFLHLTGRELREEEAENFFKTVARMRMRR
ncbi:ATP-binding cassette domain-containing protein [Thermotoga sp. KOL6]|uniref:ATP-binding cassette domain-containing protein n=1 Tax=Thermotoga sp. KOL6 TaxID=126741 RepID=UPI000C77947F|nr:ATP-binding cassette domain-containing protein [Thermotoga sp. KOL6]PLV60067.1 ABC transporter ATP-binding protein [Thermotoga sp. KOL6]